MSIEDIRSYILWWNNTFPFDRWWRDKHNVAFNSPKHQEMSIIDIFIEYEEEVFFANYRNQIQTKADDRYIPGRGQIFKPRRMSQKQIEAQFDAIDLDDYDSPDVNSK